MVATDIQNSEASVIDIVSFGYRQAFQKILIPTKLTIPSVIIGGITGFLQTYQLSLPKTDPMQAVVVLPILILSLINLYNYYCVSLYVRDSFFAEAQDPIESYWTSRHALVKVILFALLAILLFVPMIIVGLIGLILLIIPGVIWFSYVYTTYNIVYALLLDNPEMGVRGSIKEAFRLIKNNFARTIGLSLSSGVIYIAVASPMSLGRGILAYITKAAPSQAGSIGLLALSGGLNALFAWFTLTVGFCGAMFVTYRYIVDLKARHGDMDNHDAPPSNMPPGTTFGINR